MNNPQHPDHLVNLGLKSHMAGDHAAAAGLYRQALMIDPDQPEALHLLGVLAMDEGRLAEARGLVEKSLMAKPVYPEALNSLGTILKDLGEGNAAAEAYLQAVDLVPEFAEAWTNLADLYRQSGRLDEAEAAIVRARSIAPSLTPALAVAGAIALDRGAWEDAVQLLRAALARDADLLDARVNLTAALQRANHLNEALTVADETAELFPKAAAAWNALGTVRYDLRDYTGALDAYDRALTLAPDHPDAALNRGNALARLGRLDEAAAALEAVTVAHPENPTALVNLGGVRQAQGQIKAALDLFDRALGIDPDHADGIWNRGLARLLTGDLAGGFADYEVRWRLPEFAARHIKIPAWDSGDLDGQTILIHSEQGFGDTLQFVRYAPLLAARGATVVVETHPALVRLVSLVDGVSLAIARGEEAQPVDFQVPVMSLPHLFRTEAGSIPADVPYVALAPDVEIDLGGAKEMDFLVGIAWAGRSTHKNDLNRSIPLEMLEGLMTEGAARFVSLQLDDRGDELGQTDWGRGVLDLRPQIGDFADSATAIAALDLVITVDTAVAHLAGALGKPVWILLPFAPDWRWQLDRADSPWYPSARLFRQPEIGDWESVLTNVARELAALEKDMG